MIVRMKFILRVIAVLSYVEIFLFFNCIRQHPSVAQAVLKGSDRKNSIILIDMSSDDFEKMDPEKFRMAILKVTAKIQNFHPALIHLNNAFSGGMKGDKEFAEDLNSDFPTISAFELSEEEVEKNVPRDLKLRILRGNIPGTDIFRSNQIFQYKGIKFPYYEMVNSSRALCSYIMEANEKDEIELIHYYNRYKDHLFTNCPVVLANEVLKEYKLQITYDHFEGRFILFSYMSDQPGPIKYIDENSFLEDHKLPIEFKEFPEYDGMKFLDSDDLKIPAGSIFIINTTNQKFKTTAHKELTGTQILASEVYTLLDSISKPLTFRNKVNLKEYEFDAEGKLRKK